MSHHLQLPKALREQIDPEQEKKRRKAKPELSRKESRKQERIQKKQRRSEYFSQPTGTTTHAPQKRPAAQETSPRKKPKVDDPPPQKKEDIAILQQSHKLVQKKVEKPKQPVFDPALLLNPDPEDAEIARLEKLLGGKSRRKKAGGFDTLLQELDGFSGDAEAQSNTEVRADELSSEPELEAGFNSSESEEDDSERSDTAPVASQASDFSEWEGVEDRDIGSPSELSYEHPKDNVTPNSDLQQIKSDADKYIPPHLRLKQLGSDMKSLLKVKRNLKGMLNRLTEQNIGGILAEIEGLSRNERRHDVIVAMTDLILESLSSSAALTTSFMVLHAALVGALYRVIGVDFAAHFVTELITKYERQYNELLSSNGDRDESGKECSNLLVLLSELYIFQVISCVIVFDVIRNLLKGDFHETEVELLLKLVRGCGPRLRQDDPEALKDIHDMMIANIAEKQITLSSRSKFMMETLGDLKNNKLKHLAPPVGEAENTERLKKFLSGLNKNHHLKSHEPLRFTLSDVRSSNTKGKWWLVGAAWSGDPLNDLPKKSLSSKVENVENERLLKLSRKQGMNTDIRRSIFLVLMTSEDYLDARERLTGLRLNEAQQREMIRVLFHCCGSETSYNPYYTLTAQQLCIGSHSHKVTLQYCLWDFLRDLGEEAVGGAEIVKAFSHNARNDRECSTSKLSNIARAMAWWIAKDAVSLTVFKPVDFAIIQPQTQRFFEIFFKQLFVSSQVTSPVAEEVDPEVKHNRDTLVFIFQRALKIQELTHGLLYIVPSLMKKRKKESEFISWCLDIVKNTLRSGDGGNTLDYSM